MTEKYQKVVDRLGPFIAANIKEHTFSTGSKGFLATGKLVVSDTERYQVTMNVVLIGSKPAAK